MPPLAVPVRLDALPEDHPDRAVEEVAALCLLQERQLQVAPTIVVPSLAEERFYRLNNLPERLSGLFRNVDCTDPDEDDLEELTPLAQDLVRSHYLLDEFIDLFYEALESFPEQIWLRRPGESGTAAFRGRPALMTLRQVWLDDWTLEAVRRRLVERAEVAIDERPILIQGSPGAPAAAPLSQQVNQLLRRPTSVFVDAEGRLVRLASGASTGTT